MATGFRRMFKWIGSDALLMHTGLLFIATVITSVCNIGFQMVVSRALPKSEYSLLATFLAVLAIFSRPLATLSTAMARSCSLLAQRGENGLVRNLWVKWSFLTAVPAIVLAISAFLLSTHIAGFFHLERRAPVVVAALALPAIFMAPVFGGAINGLQRFGWVAISTILGAVGRLVLASSFVLFLAPACGWALAGHVGGMYVSVVILFVVLWSILLRFKSAGDKPLPSLRLYLVQCFFVQVSAAVLMTGDVVMVQRYIPDDTGFAFSATLGRMVAFMAVSVATAMFPKVSSTGAFSREQRRVFLRSQLYTAGFVLLAMAICCSVPGLLLRILFKIADPEAVLVSQTRWMAVVMGLSTLLNTNVSLLLAQHRMSGSLIVVGAATMYIVGAAFFHASALQIVAIGGGMNLLAFVLTSVFILRIRCSD